MPFGSDMFTNKAICDLVLYYDSLTSSSPLTLLLLLCLIGQVHFEKVKGVTISNLGAEGSILLDTRKTFKKQQCWDITPRDSVAWFGGEGVDVFKCPPCHSQGRYTVLGANQNISWIAERGLTLLCAVLE